jgi:hypothetical protein|tara:strand:+ start:1698 stop:3107 length:1410 start_codon:yes stop_codon:yes gene_type:complete
MGTERDRDATLGSAAKALAGAAGIEYGDGIPTKGGKEAIPAPQYTLSPAGQHLFTWTDAATKEIIRIQVAHPVRTGLEFWCILTVQYRVNADSRVIGILNGKRWNLTSTSNTDGQVRSLNRRMKDRGWDARLVQVEGILNESIETGSKLTDLSAVSNPTPARYTLAPFLEHGQINTIGAYGGSTKSIFAMACCISYSYGEIVIPGTTVAPEPRPSLYLDYEADDETQAWRRRQLLEGIGVAEQASKVFHKRLSSPIQDATDELFDLILANDIGLVVVDSGTRAVGGATSKEEVVIPLFNTMASWGVTVLLVVHKSKDPESLGPSGVAQWWNQSRNYWEIVKDQTPGQPEVYLAFRHDKSNNGALSKPMSFRLSFEDSIKYFPEGVSRSTKVQEGLHISTMIVNFLEEFPRKTVKEISNGIKKGMSPVRAELKKNEGTMFVGSADRYDRKWSNTAAAEKEVSQQRQWWSD